MSHTRTQYLNLLKIDPNAEMSLSDFLEFFRANRDTIDSNIKAIFDRIAAVAESGYTPILPVEVASSYLSFWCENAASGFFDLPTLLPTFPENTPVRVTGFVIRSLTSETYVDSFYSALDRLYGLDASHNGVNKAQMHGTIDMGTTAIGIDKIQSWRERYPDITVTSTNIQCTVRYYNHDGSVLLYTETVIYGNDAVYNVSAIYLRRNDHPEGYFYVFDGWSATADTVVNYAINAHAGTSGIRNGITSNKILYAAYLKYPRNGPIVYITQSASSITDTVIGKLQYRENYELPTYLIYNKADGSYVTNKSVSSSGDVILDNGTVTIHMFSDLFTGFNHSLYFKQTSANGGKEILVPIVILPNKPYLRVKQYASSAGDTAVIDIVHWGNYTKVNSLKYKLTSSSDEQTVTSPSVIFNMDTTNSRFSITLTSSAMASLSASYAVEFEDDSQNTVKVIVPNLFRVRS